MKLGIAILALVSACTAARVPHRSDTASIEVAYPQPITMDRFEAMLQRASQILRTPPQVVEPSVELNEHIQPSRQHEVNYYLPMYHTEKSQKLDAKSRQMLYMRPPPEENQATNFYVIKQKKLPKKFMHTAKHINVKGIVDDVRGEMSHQTRDYSNDHNIVFDDTFFGVDGQAVVPDEVPQEHNTDNGFIAPIYSRKLHKTDDMFATSAFKREARIRMGMPMSRYSIVTY